MTRVSLAGGRLEEKVDIESVHRISQDPNRKWELWWQWGGELVNPILVKEVRQSLKSRQFEISFGLTLLAAVVWTLLFMSFSVPRIFFMSNGGLELLRGYAIILLVPLLIIIPFSAYRSLTSEMEEATFELLSITSLSAKQIITGKMATAVLQLVLYVSALGPCIVLTYLLRGVSLFSILVLLGSTIVYSIMLVSCALMVATVARTRSGQNGMSVLLLALLVISFFSFTNVILLRGIDAIAGVQYLPRQISVVILAIVTILIALFSLMMQTAAAAIDFPSENKSTPIRKRLLILLGVLLFWLAMFLASNTTSLYVDSVDVCSGLIIPFFIVWTAIGGLVCGERGIISPRARRSLPKTFVGRVLFTWLSPGAGLGYVFMVVVFASVAALIVGVLVSVSTMGRTVNKIDEFIGLCYLLTCFTAFYVGACRLCMLAVGRRAAAPMVASFSVLVVLCLVLQVVPYYVASYFNDFNRIDYEWHQVLNVFLAIRATLTGGWQSILGNLVGLSLASLLVFGLNLLLTTKDVMILRIAAPERVLQETQAKSKAAEQLATDPFAVD